MILFVSNRQCFFNCLYTNFVCFARNFCSLSTLQRYGRNAKSLIGVFFNFEGEFFNLLNGLLKWVN